jgi:pimeloyl-ACP methyl ester carboxylesterase
VSGLIVLLGCYNHASSQSSRASQAHRHVGIGKTASVDIPEFSMVETSVEAAAKKENRAKSRNGRYEAFTVSDTRLLVADRQTAKVFEIKGLPMEWRPFSDLVWVDNQTLVFDRWSQPHYGVHYEVNVKQKKLIKAVPFPDKIESGSLRSHGQGKTGRTPLACCFGLDLQNGTAKSKTIEIPFTSYDRYEMFGKLTIPTSPGSHPVVIYVQTAEGMTVDMKRRKSRTETFNYFDLYRDKLPEMKVAFFSYEGRGIRMGEEPPRYETINWNIYNTSTLENKVRDVMSAVELVKKQPGIDASHIFLMGASEGTLLAAEAAARMPRQIRGLILYGVLTANMRENFKYIVTDGSFLSWRANFDADKDGRVSQKEFEADPHKFRERALKNEAFKTFDKNGDGFFTAEELVLLSERLRNLRDAVDAENYEVLNEWARTSAGVSTPKDWFKDQFAHQPIWTFLAKLNIAVGCFQGSADAMVPIEGVRKLEEQAKKAGKTKMEFHYFENLDHSLNVGEYFVKGTLPAGHQAIFEFIRQQTTKK